MEVKTYQYTDDSWEDYGDTFDDEGDSFPPLLFETYNAVGWAQNGSATSMWNLYVDAIVAHKAGIWHTHEELSGASYTMYEGFTLQELMTLCSRLGIVLERV